MAEYRRRVINDVLDELVAELPAIELHGPKGVGKTATALQRARSGSSPWTILANASCSRANRPGSAP